jgi:hypothetical protein
MNIADEIKRHMALAFFGSAYADMAEECGEPLQGEIMDQLPDEIDAAAIHAADTLAMDMERVRYNVATGHMEEQRTLTLELIYKRALAINLLSDDKGDRPFTAEMFGHYCAMQAMGHGVGLYDAFGSAVYQAIVVPYVEFSSCSLQKDYFTAPADEGTSDE